jgi:hypothetical protein
MNVELLRSIHAGTHAKPLIRAQNQIIAAQLHTDEFSKKAVISEASEHHRSTLKTTLSQRGISSVHRRRLLQQTLRATKEDFRSMLVEKERRSQLGHHKCRTCERVKRGCPHKTWVRADHLIKAEMKLMEQYPKRFNYCDCKSRLEEKWHVIQQHSKGKGCLNTKRSSIMPLLNCGHRVYCEGCVHQHAFCPICSRRYSHKKAEKREHQNQYRRKEEEANEKKLLLEKMEKMEIINCKKVNDSLDEFKAKIVNGDLLTNHVHRLLVPYPSRIGIERIKMRRDSRRSSCW